MRNSSVREDYYEVLDVDHSASEADIKRAYRKLARKYHPDVNRDAPDAEERFKQISEAYAVLSDPQRRAQYDRYGHGTPDSFDFGGSPLDIFEVFADAFGGDPFGFGQSGTRRAPVGHSLRYNLQVTLEEVLSGVDKEITYTRRAACGACDGSGAAPGSSPKRCATCGGMGQVRSTRNTFIGTVATVHNCPTCRGAGEVIEALCERCKGRGVLQRTEALTITVPAGVASGDELLVRGFGEAPAGGGRTGDLHVRITILPHERFARKGDDLHAELPISFAQAALGHVTEFAGLDGPVEVTIPAATQTAEELVVPARGLPRTDSAYRGQLRLHVRVLTPTDLTPDERELLTAFANERGEDIEPQDRGLFDRIRRAITG